MFKRWTSSTFLLRNWTGLVLNLSLCCYFKIVNIRAVVCLCIENFLIKSANQEVFRILLVTATELQDRSSSDGKGSTWKLYRLAALSSNLVPDLCVFSVPSFLICKNIGNDMSNFLNIHCVWFSFYIFQQVFNTETMFFPSLFTYSLYDLLL